MDSEASFAPVLALNPGLHRVIPCEIRRWRKSPLAAATRQEWRAFRAALRHDAYDAVIDLQGLTKSALVARLARLAPGGRRFALANQTEGSSYEAPTRWVDYVFNSTRGELTTGRFGTRQHELHEVALRSDHKPAVG